MARVMWDISGKIKLEPMNGDVRTAFGTAVPIEGVRVLVEAKEFGADPTWDNWGEVITDSEGVFRLRKEKDRTRRRFRIRVLFKSDQLKIYPEDSLLDSLLYQLLDPLVPAGLAAELFDATLMEQIIEQTTRIAYDVKWVTVHENHEGDKFEPATVRIPDCVFSPGGRQDLGTTDHRKRAEIWFLAHKLINYVNSLGSGVSFASDKPLAIKYPHNNMIIPDAAEASYADPHNSVTYLVRNGSHDDFDPQVIFHELMHQWEYQNTVGETGLAWQLLFHDPHGRAKDSYIANPWVGWYEAFAEVTANELYRKLFGIPGDYGSDRDGDGSIDPVQRRPFSRAMLRTNGVTVMILVDHFEIGWLSALNLLLCKDVQSLDMNTTSVYATDPTPGRRPAITTYVAPTLSLSDLMTVVASDGGMERDAMTLTGFYDRVASVLGEFTEAHKNAYLALLDPEGTAQPTDVLPRSEGVATNPGAFGAPRAAATP